MEDSRTLHVKMGHLIKVSSKFIFDRFLTDDGDQKDAFAQLEDFQQRLALAATHKLLVVLQVKSAKLNEIEMISGWVLTRRSNGKQVIVKLLNGPTQWRIIEIDSILKMSQLPINEEKRISKIC